MCKQEKINDAIKSAGLMMLLSLALSMLSIKMAIVVGVVIILLGGLWDNTRGSKLKIDWYSVAGDATGIIMGITLAWMCDEYIGIL